MKITAIIAIILSLGVVFIIVPSSASAIELVANDPATIYYTTNGADPATTMPNPYNDAATEINTTSSETVMSALSGNVFDGYYILASTTASWDGADANRMKLPTADYASTYGDDSQISYTLPWTFSFYGQSFNQILADTNGNIWFGSAGYANSYNLPTMTRGPVIVAWNNDLSSYYRGGVFVQHRTNPERVVIEWQTETYTDEGRNKPNNFEVVIFPNGQIRLDYKSFSSSATNTDYGSGVSLNDGIFFVNLTANAGNVFSLGGQSFLLTASGTTKTLDVNFPTGAYGTVYSNVGVSWSTGNITNYPTGAHITLRPDVNLGYKFDSWSNNCSVIDSKCTFTLNNNTIIYAYFSYDPAQNAALFWPDGNKRGYYTLQGAFNAAPWEASTLKLRAATFSENITADYSRTITIQGGYNGDYSARNAGESVIFGTLTISGVTLVIDSLSIR